MRYPGLSYLFLILTELSGDPYHCNRQEPTGFVLGSNSEVEELFTYLPVCRDGLSLFDNGDIPWDDLTGRNLLLFPLANDLIRVEALIKERCGVKGMRAYNGYHGNACFELFNDIARLFLLIPADECIKHKNSNLRLRAEQTEATLARERTMTPKSTQSLRPAARSTANSMTFNGMLAR